MPCDESPCVRCDRPAREGRDGVNVFDDTRRVFAGPLCHPCLADLLIWLEPCAVRAVDPGCGSGRCPISPGNPERMTSCDDCPRKPEPCPTPGLRELVIPVRVELPECEREKLKAIRTLLGG